MKIALWALALAAIWTIALFVIATTVGVHSAPGMWTGAIGLPGVVIGNWIQRRIVHAFYRPVGYSLMFLINWVFYCTVLQGIQSARRTLWNRPQ